MAVRNRGLEVRKETATPTGEKGGSCAWFNIGVDAACGSTVVFLLYSLTDILHSNPKRQKVI
jgi:hypothetical protein